jgi:prepilin-type N-terminal cleavage/methylation domain-containing protein
MHSSRKRFRHAFTLIELLMVVSIIAVLSSLALVVIRDAQETAFHARSTSLVTQIQAVMAAKMEEYETRQLPFRPGFITNKNTGNPTNWAERQQIRQRALLDWIRSEIPSVAADLNLACPYPNGLTNYSWSGTEYINFYRLSSGARKVANEMTGFNGASDPKIFAAKCLYAILQTTWHNDSRAIDICKPGEVLTDSLDGKRYIVDAFGEPLSLVVFIDWNGNGIFDQNLTPAPGSIPEELQRNLDGFQINGSPQPLPDLNQIAVQVAYRRQNER